MSKIHSLTLVLAVGAAASLAGHASPASAASAKYQACLKEAEAKGLLVTNGGGRAAAGRANAGLLAQRKAFMQECMSRK